VAAGNAVDVMSGDLILTGSDATDAVEVTTALRVPILLVDDNASKRIALKAVLAPLGYSIVEAASGIDALRCVMAHDFAVILLDVCMPVMDGFETAALIRQRHQSELTPIIFITASQSDEIIDADLYAEGAVDFIFAPVPPQELRAKVTVFANIFIKAAELATHARTAQTSADQLRLLTDAAPVGIFQTDGANRYLYTNPRWTEITGIAPAEAAGRYWDFIIDARERATFTVDLASVDGSHAEISHRFELHVPGAPTRTALLTSKSIPDRDGSIAGWVGTLADVTAEAGAEAAMSEARDRANEASRLKSDFLANMSHEIRTPMNGVIGMADLLLETGLDARQRDYAQTVRNSGEALLTIINNILDFSKVEAGQLEIEDVEFDVMTIVDDVVKLLAGSLHTGGLELVTVVAHSVPDVVSGDPGRVRQVLTNLLGNAIKFTQNGEIVVRVTACEVVGAETVVRFEVTDTGDGIAPDKLGLIFQPFVQADTSTSRKYGGTGLGLAISGQLVALMGGDCGMSSELDAGSTFWFTIRVHADAQQVASEALSRDVELAGFAALVVDDNATQREVMTEYLGDWGMKVTTAACGPAAIEAMRTAAFLGRPFAVAFIDRAMPGMDGLELIDAVGGDPLLTVPVVLMIGLGEERELGEAEELGVCAFLPKPVHRGELRTCARVALGLEVTAAAPAAVIAPLPRMSGRGLILLAEDNLINQKVAVAMLSGAGYRVDTVVDGRAAVAAVDAQPYDAILMDCQMPELNGYEATAAIRAHEGPDRHTPIIAMTAGARREDRDRCIAEGMDGYVAKPVSKDALLALVARSVKGHDEPSAAAPSVPASHAAAEITIDLAVLDELRLLGEATDQDFLAEIVNEFVHDTEPRLIDLRDAAALGDAELVGRIAHSIKGSGDQLGGRRLALSCGRLERKAVTGRLAQGQTDLQEVEFDYQELCHALGQQLASAGRRRGGHHD
jgi:two-component system sensor histidine kinase/response regulator